MTTLRLLVVAFFGAYFVESQANLINNDQCPANTEMGLCQEVPNACQSDADCYGGDICCPHSCSKICKPPGAGGGEGVMDLLHHPAVYTPKCPGASCNSFMSFSKPLDQCGTQRQCPNLEQTYCCNDGCSNVCQLKPEWAAYYQKQKMLKEKRIKELQRQRLLQRKALQAKMELERQEMERRHFEEQQRQHQAAIALEQKRQEEAKAAYAAQQQQLQEQRRRMALEQQRIEAARREEKARLEAARREQLYKEQQLREDMARERARIQAERIAQLTSSAPVSPTASGPAASAAGSFLDNFAGNSQPAAPSPSKNDALFKQLDSLASKNLGVLDNAVLDKAPPSAGLPALPSSSALESLLGNPQQSSSRSIFQVGRNGGLEQLMLKQNIPVKQSFPSDNNFGQTRLSQAEARRKAMLQQRLRQAQEQGILRARQQLRSRQIIEYRRRLQAARIQRGRFFTPAETNERRTGSRAVAPSRTGANNQAARNILAYDVIDATFL